MAVPLIIGGAALAAGMIGGGIGLATKAGQNRQRYGSFSATKDYNRESTMFGGTARGLQDYTSSRDVRGMETDDRKANLANYAGANQWEAASQGARTDQSAMAGLMSARARGFAPSIAGMQANEQMRQLGQQTGQQMQQAQAAQAAQAASARGAAGVALAQQNAAANTANAQAAIGSNSAMAAQGISNQAQINAANERMQAEQAAFGAYGNLRGGDVSSQGLSAQQAQFQAAQEQANRNANDTRTMGYENLIGDAYKSSQAAAVGHQGQLAQAHAAADRQNFERDQRNAEAEKGFFSKLFSDENAKEGMDIGTMAQLAPLLSKGGAAFASDTEAKKAATLAQGQEQGLALARAGGVPGVDAQTVAQQDRDVAALPQWSSRDPAVGLSRVGEHRRQQALASQIDPGSARPRAASAPVDEPMTKAGEQMAPGTADFMRTAPKGDGKQPWWMTPVDMGEIEKLGNYSDDRTKLAAVFEQGRQAGARGQASLEEQAESLPKEFVAPSGPSPLPMPANPPDRKKRLSYDFGGQKRDREDPGAPARGRPSNERRMVSFERGDSAEVARGGKDPEEYVTDETVRRLTGVARYDKPIASDKIAYAPGPDGRPVALPPGSKDARYSASHPLLEYYDRVAGTRADGGPVEEGRPYLVGERGPEVVVPKRDGNVIPNEVLPLYEPPGQELHQSAEGRAFYSSAADEDDGRPRLASPSSSRKSTPQAKAKSPGLAKPKTREMTPDEMSAAAERMRREMSAEHETRMAAGASVRPYDSSLVAEANRTMAGSPYSYKDGFRPPTQQPGEPNFGPMAQNLEKNPISATAVKMDPDTGMRVVDRDKALKVAMAGIADLQRQQDETRALLYRPSRRR